MELIIFTMTLSILKTLSQTCETQIKNHTKTLVFTTLDTSQLKRIDDCEKIYSVNPLFLNVTRASGYIEEKVVNKYLVFDSTDENKQLIKKYNDVFNGIRDKIK